MRLLLLTTFKMHSFVCIVRIFSYQTRRFVPLTVPKIVLCFHAWLYNQMCQKWHNHISSSLCSFLTITAEGRIKYEVVCAKAAARRLNSRVSSKRAFEIRCRIDPTDAHRKGYGQLPDPNFLPLLLQKYIISLNSYDWNTDADFAGSMSSIRNDKLDKINYTNRKR